MDEKKKKEEEDTWMDPEIITLSDMSDRERQMSYDSMICGI